MARVGIDFGTTNSSLIAYDKRTKKFLYFTSEDEAMKPTPSTVWYHDKKIVVGKAAKEQINSLSNVPGHHIESSIKSKLGSGKKISILGELVEPYKIASDIFSHLKDIAISQKADRVGVNYKQAVLTVPINFNGKQRIELRKAAEHAGISVDTFIHEPFAALIGYLFSEDNINEHLHTSNSHILVFDWGGGTLDITVAKLEGKRIWELSSSELSGIAGDKFDDELVNLFKNRFIEQHSKDFPREYLIKKLDERLDALRIYAEDCKISLSTEEEYDIQIDEIFFDQKNQKYYDYTDKIKRSDFESCIKHHVDAAVNRIRIAINEASVSYEQISLVLMTGGSSYIPMVKKAVEDIFGSRVRWPKNPDLVIAQGAAVINEMNWSPFLSKNIMLELSDESYWTIFEKNMPLVRDRMNEKKELFTCVDIRSTVAKVIIAEGRNNTSKDKNLAIIEIPILNDERSRTTDDICLSFNIDENIVLNASGYGLNKGHRKQMQIHQICFGLDMEE